VIGTVPILFGAVQPWVWSFYVEVIFFAYLIKIWQVPENGFEALGKTGRVFLGLLWAWSFFQIIPLPRLIFAFLSPWKSLQSTQAISLIDKTEPWEAITYSWRVSLGEIAFILGLVMLYLLCRDSLKTRREIKMIVWIMIALGCFEALYGIIQTLVPAIGVLWMDPSYAYMGNARGTYVNRNHFAGLMEMILPVTIGYTMAIGYWPIRGKLKRILVYDRLNQVIFFTIIIITLLLGLVFSISRAGIMGFMVALMVFFAISRVTLRRKPKVLYLMVSAILVLFLAYGGTMGFKPVFDRFLQIGSDTSRLDIWKDSLGMAKDHPLGVGLGNYEYVYPVYQVNFTPKLNVLDAHNDYLQVLNEAGWPGFVVLIGGYLFFMGTRIKRLLKMKPEYDPLFFFLGTGAFSGLAAIGFHSFFDFNLQIPANCVYFVVLMALVDAAVGRGKERDRKRVLASERQSGSMTRGDTI
jgi:O-antigen ligase